jgi:4-pyridoxate dehydrogenase
LNDDYNAERQDGFARMQMTIRNGRRESAATAYLHPVLARKNLTVMVRAQVTRVVFESQRAIGVEYVKDVGRQVAHAEREVIVSAGAVNSPQILMLSGIGEPAALAAHGIKVKAPLPGVGQNLQDHTAALLIYGRSDQSPLVRNMRADRLALGIAEAFALGSGFMTDLPGGITGFVKADAGHPALVHCRIACGRAVFSAVSQGIRRQLRLPHRAAAARKPRQHNARLVGSVRPSAHSARALIDRE